MRRLDIHLGMALPLLCLVMAGCVAPGTPTLFTTSSPVILPTPTPSDELTLPFETLATNDTGMPPEFGVSPVRVSSPVPGANNLNPDNPKWYPWLALVTSPEDTVPFQPYLALEQQAVLAALDYNRYAALVLWGGVGDGLMSIYIHRIAATQNGALSVHAVVRWAAEGTPQDEYPSQVVRLVRTDVPFALTTDVSLLLTTTTQHVP